jgi:hypothetical protein
MLWVATPLTDWIGLIMAKRPSPPATETMETDLRRHALSYRMTDESYWDLRRFVQSREIALGRRLTHQAVIDDALTEYMAKYADGGGTVGGSGPPREVPRVTVSAEPGAPPAYQAITVDTAPPPKRKPQLDLSRADSLPTMGSPPEAPQQHAAPPPPIRRPKGKRFQD